MSKQLLEPLAKYLKGEIQKELLSQGHKATGELYDSIDVKVSEELGRFTITGSNLFYGRFVDTGRKSGGKKVPITALIEWIKVKKLDLKGKSETSVAFAIQAAIHKKGIPTDGDQSKKRFITKTIEKNEDFILKEINKIFTQIVNITFTDMINRAKKNFI